MARRIIALLIMISLFACFLKASAADTLPYPTYTIDGDYNEAQSPAAYIPQRIFYGEQSEAGQFENPADLEIKDEKIYIIDSERNAFFVFDLDFKLLASVEGFEFNGKEERFNSPQGINVSSSGDIYVADTDNSRIVKFSSNYEASAIFEKPSIITMPDDYVYKPLKLGVDPSDRIYVVAQGINEGLIELDSSGGFMSFMGAPNVKFDLFTYIWKQLLTRQQADYLLKFVPTEFSNLKIDADGFVYANIKSNDIEELYGAIKTFDQYKVVAVKKMNASGRDVLNRYGEIPIVGDVNFNIDADSDASGAAQSSDVAINPSTFVDITVDGAGTYYCLDSKRGRIFTYDIDGNLLYAFGSLGNQDGNFTIPVAIDTCGNRLYVLDNALKRVTVFSRTEYGDSIYKAAKCYSDGDYEQSFSEWSSVIRQNANLRLAYIGIGKSCYYLGDYEKSYKYLKLADESYYASKAYEKYMTNYIADRFYIIFGALVAVVIVIAAAVILRKKKRKVP